MQISLGTLYANANNMRCGDACGLLTACTNHEDITITEDVEYGLGDGRDVRRKWLMSRGAKSVKFVDLFGKEFGTKVENIKP